MSEDQATEPVVVRERGRCKWFNNSLTFGFLLRGNSEDSVFVHYTQILTEGYRTINQGEEVEFEVIATPKGPQAVNVKRITQAAAK